MYCLTLYLKKEFRLVFFTIGKMFYKPEKLFEENILVKFYGCIKHALINKWREGCVRRTYWLQHAIGRYEETFVEDVSKVLKVCFLCSLSLLYYITFSSF